jgi:hypothetical protein
LNFIEAIREGYKLGEEYSIKLHNSSLYIDEIELSDERIIDRFGKSNTFYVKIKKITNI